MAASATSFEVESESAERVVSAFSAALARVGRPSGALLCASGTWLGEARRLAAALGTVPGRPPTVLATGPRVFTERRELDPRHGVAGLVWSGGRTEVAALQGESPDELGEALVRVLGDRRPAPEQPVLLFAEPSAASEALFGQLAESPLRVSLFGGGVLGTPGVFAIQPNGVIERGAVVLASLRGLGPARVAHTPACRRLGPWSRVTGARGSFVTALDGRPVLEVLAHVGRDAGEEKLLLVLLADERPEETDPLGGCVVRLLRGVDPEQGSLGLPDAIAEGSWLAFAVLDPAAAQANVERATAGLARELAGAAPRFGFLVSAAGQGLPPASSGGALHALQRRLPGMPLVGLQSAFSLAPTAGATRLQLYTTTLGVFAAPS